MLRKKTSAIRYNKNYNHNFEFMGLGVVGSGGGCDSTRWVAQAFQGLTYIQIANSDSRGACSWNFLLKNITFMAIISIFLTLVVDRRIVGLHEILDLKELHSVFKYIYSFPLWLLNCLKSKKFSLSLNDVLNMLFFCSHTLGGWYSCSDNLNLRPIIDKV